jgi:hypothetical protein
LIRRSDFQNFMILLKLATGLTELAHQNSDFRRCLRSL